MNTEQLAALFCEGFGAIGLAPRQSVVNQCVVYVRELRRWNVKMNLTGHHTDQGIIGNLFIDSLACARDVIPDKPSSVLDIGSGAGFPGMPIHMFFPQHEMTLLEPNLKKVAFLHHLIGLLGLQNVRVESERMEQFAQQSEWHGKFDRVLMKALRLGVGLSYVTPVLAASGQCVVWRTRPLPLALDLQGLSVVKNIPYELPFGFGARLLSIIGRCQ